MARIFSADETQANTKRVVGTYGYMSPEYALDGIFSTKSDVFSFGVMLLEIISGKKNRGFFHDDPYSNLIQYTWELWRDITTHSGASSAKGTKTQTPNKCSPFSLKSEEKKNNSKEAEKTQLKEKAEQDTKGVSCSNTLSI
ncbi:hypothetical protein QYF36_003278 [Acer negundo]|nr:hypothetical protein QYF36_003278 [Acer negundo]